MGTKVGTKYHPSTLVQLPAKGNKWFVVVTLPKALQTTKNLRRRKSTGTTDHRTAKSLQHQITQEIYAEFDEALKPAPLTLPELRSEHWPLFDCLDFDEAVMFRNYITPKLETNPYPSSSQKRQMAMATGAHPADDWRRPDKRPAYASRPDYHASQQGGRTL